MKNDPIKILVVDGVKTRKFTVEIECSGHTFKSWKGHKETDQQFIERMIKSGLSQEGLARGE